MWKVSVLGAFFWCEFFPVFGLNMETYRVSLCIQVECGIMQARLTQYANTFHVVDIRSLLCYFDAIVL